MKIISWNVNGIRAAHKKDLPKLFDTKFADIICLQEVKAWPEQLAPELLTPNNFKAHYSIAKKKGYSGVATYQAPELSSKQFNTGFGIEIFDQEGRIISLAYEHFDLYNIYFPSGTTGELRQNFKYEFLNYIANYFSSLSMQQKSRAIICGDFNICHKEIDIHHPKQATRLALSGFLPEERAWLDSFEELGFYDAFRLQHNNRTQAYSWWSYRAGARKKNLGWRIDYFWIGSSMKAALVDCEICSDFQGSDHAPVFIHLDL